jgi:hypothetical protein
MKSNNKKVQVFKSHFLEKKCYTETVAPPVNPFVCPHLISLNPYFCRRKVRRKIPSAVAVVHKILVTPTAFPLRARKLKF